MKITDRAYLVKLKTLQFPDSEIAKRMGTTEEQVRSSWSAIVLESETMRQNGYGDACLEFSHVCAHYQALGEHLKEVSRAFSNAATVEEIQKVLGSREMAEEMMSRFLVLKPYSPPKEDSQSKSN